MTVTIHSNEERHLGRAIGRGFLCKCPNCGKGALFRKYLKVVDRCAECGEEFHHHRADDLPAYLSIVLVGHVIVFLLMELSLNSTYGPITSLMILLPLSVVLTLLLLQPIKGAVVGLQWANRMHGFDSHYRDPALPDEQV